MKTFFIALCFLFFFSSPKALSHPVAFKGSVGIMGQHSPILAHNQINHSFQYWYALGGHYFVRPDAPENNASFLSANFLIKRWNTAAFQANIYGVVGLGQSQFQGRSVPTGLSALQFDIEDRRLYFLVKHSQWFREYRHPSFHQSLVRVGIAPYLESFENLHSWLILEWQQGRFDRGDDYSDVTPFLRLFYRNVLFELGQSFKGMTRFNYIVHF